MLGGVFHLHEQEAREVMTPIPAVVTVDASETVETALRRCVTSGHTRLVVIEDDNPDRVKGIVHNNSLARLYMSDGPGAGDRAGDPRRADRPRDPAARRPAPRPAGPAHLALGGRRRVRAHGRHRHRRGHPRGGGRRDRGRDRPARRGPAPAHQRRLVRPRPRLARRPRRRRHRAAGRHRRLQLGRRLRLRRAGPAAEAGRHDRRRRLHDPGRVGAREPDRGGADQRRRSVRPGCLVFPGNPRPRSWRYRMWVVRLSDKQLEVLRALLRSEEHLGPALKGAVEALDLARWDELPEAELPWDEIAEVAQRQRCSEADVIWDLSGRRRRAVS